MSGKNLEELRPHLATINNLFIDKFINSCTLSLRLNENNSLDIIIMDNFYDEIFTCALTNFTFDDLKDRGKQQKIAIRLCGKVFEAIKDFGK